MMCCLAGGSTAQAGEEAINRLLETPVRVMREMYQSGELQQLLGGVK